MEKTELKPCPFCGEVPTIDKHPTKKYFSISCWDPNCVCMPKTGWYISEEKAAEAWNERADNV